MTPDARESAVGTVFDVQRYSLQNGPGIRTTVFLKGCDLRCWWCCNPESQAFAPEITFDPALCRRCGRCAAACPAHRADGKCKNVSACGLCAATCMNRAKNRCGEARSAAEIAEIALRDSAYYRRSGGGVTVSGGECLLQPDFTLEFIERAKASGVHTALDTSLYAPRETVMASVKRTDLYLVDIKHTNSAAHRRATGAGNELILQNLNALLARECHVWIRVPVIPSFNDTAENFSAMARLLAGAKTVERIELLPGHDMGLKKYETLGRAGQTVPAPNLQNLRALAMILESAGHTVIIRKI